MISVANKKKSGGEGAKKLDRHLDPKMTLRLPEEVGDALRDVADQEERTITTVVLRALRDYFKTHGYPWPTPPAEAKS